MSDAGSCACSSAAGDRKRCSTSRSAKPSGCRSDARYKGDRRAEGGGRDRANAERAAKVGVEHAHADAGGARASRRRSPAPGSSGGRPRPAAWPGRASASGSGACRPRAGSLLEGRTRKPPPFGSKGAEASPATTPPPRRAVRQRSFDRFHSVNPPPFGSACAVPEAEVGRPAVRPARSRGGGGGGRGRRRRRDAGCGPRTAYPARHRSVALRRRARRRRAIPAEESAAEEAVAAEVVARPSPEPSKLRLRRLEPDGGAGF